MTERFQSKPLEMRPLISVSNFHVWTENLGSVSKAASICLVAAHTVECTVYVCPVPDLAYLLFPCYTHIYIIQAHRYSISFIGNKYVVPNINKYFPASSHIPPLRFFAECLIVDHFLKKNIK